MMRATPDQHPLVADDTAPVHVLGSDAITLLDAIATQDIAAIPTGSARYALFLNAKAAILAAALAFRVADEEVVLLTPRSAHEELVAHMRKHRLRQKAEIRVDDVAEFQATSLLEQGADLGPASAFTTEFERLTHGTPALRDFVTGYMPAEVGAIELAVDFSKGCYLGQEPVARLHWRGRANRSLERVAVTGTPLGELPLPLQIKGSEGAAKPPAVLTTALADGPGLAIVHRKVSPDDVLVAADSGGNGATDFDVRLTPSDEAD